jgi:hypothetical protein
MSWRLAVAFVVPIVSAVVLSPWFLLLLLMPLTAVAMGEILHWRVRHSRCIRCGAPFAQTLLKCPKCGLEYKTDLN